MISTILLSGGVGVRSCKNRPKQYCELKGKMIIDYCLDELIKAGLTDELIIVYGKGYLDLVQTLKDKYRLSFVSIQLVLGGETRQESVLNGLKVCSGESVILHESARPLITENDLIEILNHPSPNVTMGLDIPFTVLKQKNGKITEVLTRNELFNVQLPQKFNRQQLLESHLQAVKDLNFFTDDSSLLFEYNVDVAVIKGSLDNIKVTNPGDFVIAEEILKNRKKF